MTVIALYCGSPLRKKYIVITCYMRAASHLSEKY